MTSEDTDALFPCPECHADIAIEPHKDGCSKKPVSAIDPFGAIKEAKKEKYRAYMRVYMPKWRAKKKAEKEAQEETDGSTEVQSG